MTAATSTDAAARAAAHDTLTRKAYRARAEARRMVPVSAALAVVTGTIALAGGALDIDDTTRWIAAVACSIVTIGFGFAVRSATLLPDPNTKENK